MTANKWLLQLNIWSCPPIWWNRKTEKESRNKFGGVIIVAWLEWYFIINKIWLHKLTRTINLWNLCYPRKEHIAIKYHYSQKFSSDKTRHHCIVSPNQYSDIFTTILMTVNLNRKKCNGSCQYHYLNYFHKIGISQLEAKVACDYIWELKILLSHYLLFEFKFLSTQQKMFHVKMLLYAIIKESSQQTTWIKKQLVNPLKIISRS